MKIGDKVIGKDNSVFVIAEAGVNYNNKLSLAYKMIDLAKKAGADAIKFQTFVAKNIQTEDSKKPKYQETIRKKSYYDIIKSLEPSFNDQKKIFDYCKKKKILFLSTPYDKDSVDFLDDLGVSAFKIASSDFTNHLFLKHVIKKQKPLLLSTGLSDAQHVDSTYSLIKKMKMKNKVCFLHTTSDYPTKNNDVNLLVIQEYFKKYKIPIGFSDHTKDYIASLGAISLGARIVEKHFTLDRNLPGPDQSSSFEPHELKEWIKKIRILEQNLGTNKKILTKSEQKNLSMRKILVIKPINKNEKISIKHLDSLRIDGNGVLPLQENMEKIIGRPILTNITKTAKFSWKMI